jgi:dihydrofolate reductase
MKVKVIATVTANGQVLLAENMTKVNTPPEVMGVFMQKAIESGNMVIGQVTYNVVMSAPAMQQALAGIEIVVLSNQNRENTGCTTVSSPEKAIEYLKGKGCENIIVAGGAQTYNSFLNAGLVTDMYLSIVPVIIGNGGILTLKGDTVLNFKLAEQKMIVDGIIQLHFTK